MAGGYLGQMWFFSIDDICCIIHDLILFDLICGYTFYSTRLLNPLHYHARTYIFMILPGRNYNWVKSQREKRLVGEV